MASFTSVAAVLEYLGNPTSSGQFAAGPVGSNIVVASAALQRLTNRQFEAQTTTKVFTTRGRASITIPDLVSASAVSLNGATLDANSSYYLIPDSRNSGVYIGIDLPQYSSPWDYRSYSDWFDKNYDSWMYQGRLRSGLPNDLSITGVWGWSPVPAELSRATMVLAAWYTKNPDAVLSGTVQTPNGDTIIIAPGGPGEVQEFIHSWKIDLETVGSL